MALSDETKTSKRICKTQSRIQEPKVVDSNLRGNPRGQKKKNNNFFFNLKILQTQIREKNYGFFFTNLKQ